MDAKIERKQGAAAAGSGALLGLGNMFIAMNLYQHGNHPLFPAMLMPVLMFAILGNLWIARFLAAQIDKMGEKDQKDQTDQTDQKDQKDQKDEKKELPS